MKCLMLHDSAADKQLTEKDAVKLMCAYSHNCTVLLLGSAGFEGLLEPSKATLPAGAGSQLLPICQCLLPWKCSTWKHSAERSSDRQGVDVMCRQAFDGGLKHDVNIPADHAKDVGHGHGLQALSTGVQV